MAEEVLCLKRYYRYRLLSNGYRGLFPWGLSGRVVKLTTHLGAIPPLPNTPQWRVA